VRRQLRHADASGGFLHDVPNCLYRHPSPHALPTLLTRRNNLPLNCGCAEPILQFGSHPVRNRNGSNVASLADQINNGPMLFALLEMTGQGQTISPLLANIYLHYVLDEWFEDVVKPRLRGEAHEIRFADDAILCLHYREDAEKVKNVLSKRFAKYGLTLHPEKTRLLEFGRYAEERAKRQGKKPGTFDFLGLTHICARRRRGKFTVHVRTMRKGSAGASRRSPNGARGTDMHRWTSSRRPSTPSSEATTSITADRQTLSAF
jgi:hypothetical protein